MIVFFAIRLYIFIFTYLPFWVLYRISDFFSFVLYVFRFKRKSITNNLKVFFADKTDDEINKLVKKVYVNFFDVLFVEMLKAFTMTKSSMHKRFIVSDSLKNYITENSKTNVPRMLCVLGHIANWEWALSFSHNITRVCLYTPLKNKYLDNYVKKNRSRFGFKLIAAKHPAPSEIFLSIQNSNEPAMFTLVADKQALKKSHVERMVWVNFMGQRTPFLVGPAIYAKRYNCRFGFVSVRRLKRGYYKADYISLCDDPASKTKEELTQMWVTCLEQELERDPAAWFWFWGRDLTAIEKLRAQTNL